MTRLFLLFTVVPTVELWLLFKVGSFIGFWETIWLVIITGFIGASMAKREGLSVLQEIQEAPAKGIPIGDKLGEGLLVLVGGILLVTPGILTDIFGMSLIFPLSRRLILPTVKEALSNRSTAVHFGSNIDFSQGSSNTVTHTISEDTQSEQPHTPRHKKGFKHPTF